MKKIEQRRSLGKNFSIIVVAEGAKPKEGPKPIREVEADKVDNVGLDAVKLGGMELIPDTIEVLSKAEALPFDYNNLEGVSIDTNAMLSVPTNEGHVFIPMKNNDKIGRMLDSFMTRGM